MDVEKAKRVLAEENERRFIAALGSKPVSVDLVIWVDGESLRQSVLLDPNGTWRINRA